MRPQIFSFPAPLYNAIAATQNITTATGGNVNINGTTRDFTTPLGGIYGALPGGGIQRTLGIFATGSLASVVFFASGLDLRGVAVSASYIGPSGGSSSATDAFATFSTGGNFEFARINNITCTQAATVLFTVGWGATGSTNWVLVSGFVNPINVALEVTTATIASITIQDTPQDVNTTSNPTVFSHATMQSVVANQQSAYTSTMGVMSFIRGIVTTNSATGVGSTIKFKQFGL